jgi:hypothetical protein
MSRIRTGVAAIAAAVCAGSASADAVRFGGAPGVSVVRLIATAEATPHAGLRGPSSRNWWTGIEIHRGWATAFLWSPAAAGTGRQEGAAFFDFRLDPPESVVRIFGERTMTPDPFRAPNPSASLSLGNLPETTLTPIPTGAAVGFAGLAGLATVMAFRRRALRA